MFSPEFGSPKVQRDRAFEQWLEQVHRVCGSFDAQPLGEHFNGHLQDLRCGALHMSLVESERLCLLKQKQHLDKDRERIFYAALQLQGHSCIEQLDARTRLAPGDLVVLDGGRPFSVHMTDQVRQIAVILPSGMLEPGRGAKAACAQRIDGSSMLGKWVRDLVLDAAIHRQQEITPLESDALLAALSSLLKPVVFQSVEEDGRAQDRLYARACRHIDEHLADETLSPEGIAQAIGVSVRGLYRVFARHQQVVSQYIKNRRLERCAAALRSGGAAAANLGALSYAWGFADASHFSLAFKKYFGVSPSDYRKRHCH